MRAICHALRMEIPSPNNAGAQPPPVIRSFWPGGFGRAGG